MRPFYFYLFIYIFIFNLLIYLCFVRPPWGPADRCPLHPRHPYPTRSPNSAHRWSPLKDERQLFIIRMNYLESLLSWVCLCYGWCSKTQQRSPLKSFEWWRWLFIIYLNELDSSLLWLVFWNLEDIGKTNWRDVRVTLQVNPAWVAKFNKHLYINVVINTYLLKI